MGHPAAGQFKPGQESPETAERWAKALELRKAGASYLQIARQLGYSNEGSAHKAVKSALDATVREPADDVRKMEVERLDRLMLGVWQRAIGGDAEALGSVLRIMNHRAALLGLLAPQKVAATNPDGTAEATVAGLPPGSFDKLVAMLALAQERRDKATNPDEPG